MPSFMIKFCLEDFSVEIGYNFSDSEAESVVKVEHIYYRKNYGFFRNLDFFLRSLL